MLPNEIKNFIGGLLMVLSISIEKFSQRNSTYSSRKIT